jgi:hypothetical protein
VWFDGWPTIVFSGWPDVSYGTFVVKLSLSKILYDNGKYRILIAPDRRKQDGQKRISIGSGAETLALLDTVPYLV